MEEDIQNHSPTVMFRGTPCRLINAFSSHLSVFNFSFCLMFYEHCVHSATITKFSQIFLLSLVDFLRPGKVINLTCRIKCAWGFFGYK